MAAQMIRTTSLDIPNSSIIGKQHLKAFPFMYWPNGRACELANMYFLDIAHQTTGESLKAYASELTHLIRFCSNNNIPIKQLTDSHIFMFSRCLQEEKSTYNLNERARNNNTVRTIIKRAINFLQWYQANLIPATETPLIGEAKVSPQIIIKRLNKPEPKYGKLGHYYVHRSMPTPDSREPKRPISLPIIEDIKACIDKLSIMDNQKERFIQRYRNNPDILAARLEYMQGRRKFMVWIMMRTGLRPSEMIEISVKEHEDILHSKRILIPTKKRRRAIAPVRSFPITLNDALVFFRYLTARTKYLAVLGRTGQDIAESDALLLTLGGRSIKKYSIQRDFKHLVEAAGYKDVQACFSMFRHRFITYEVVSHLKEFMSSSGKTAQIMTDTDYESILKRVSVKTGHGSVQSLWHYIDLAWKELDVWCNVDKAINRLHAADRFSDELMELNYELKTTSALATKKQLLQKIENLTKSFEEILKSAKQDIDINV